MNGLELVTAGHPGWQGAPHQQIRGTLTAERRRANSIRRIVVDRRDRPARQDRGGREMTSADPHGPFWIDTEYDGEHASDGVSRYGAYLRDSAFEPWTDDQAVELAVFAWRRATRPVMAPGYVRYHPRILTAQLERSDWDGSLLAMVDLVTPQPAQLRYLRFDDDRGTWRDWPSETTFTGDRAWYEPGTDDLSRSPHLLVSASLRFTVPSGQLPQPPVPASVLPGLAARELVEAARRSVAVLVRELNAIISPIIERIEEEG
jgi:hypothetical protein